MKTFVSATMLAVFGGAALLAFAGDADAQSCFSRPSSGGTCSATLATCSESTRGSTTAAGCNAAHKECMSTGRWIYRSKDGQCFDWGAREKK
jgi:hypothetical protein